VNLDPKFLKISSSSQLLPLTLTNSRFTQELKMLRRTFVLGITCCLAAFVLIGCGKKTPEPAKAVADNTEARADDHSGYWCDEHGVPHAVCTRCNSKLIAEFKAKGDWCKEHSRPDSQCFICHPELEAKFAAEYEAKTGKKPPKPEAETAHAGHDHDHDQSKDSKKPDDKKPDDKKADDKPAKKTELKT
jgi:cobalt-zinc-cadmium efflux system membrane fusion protein